MSDEYEFEIPKILNRESEKLAGQGHIMSGWIQTDDRHWYRATCQKCNGVVDIGSSENQGRGRKANRIWLVCHDLFTSLEFCPGDDPELMKMLNDEWGRRLGNVAKILIEAARRKEAEIGSSETAEHQYPSAVQNRY